MVNNGEELGHSSSVPIYLNSPIVGPGKFPFIDVFQLTGEEEWLDGQRGHPAQLLREFVGGGIP